jgi:hypothetical protein
MGSIADPRRHRVIAAANECKVLLYLRKPTAFWLGKLRRNKLQQSGSINGNATRWKLGIV